MEQAPGRGRRLRQESKESRDSSVSSTSREVRCGCQYFQTDSLLPERHSLVGTRPPSRNMGDHEYEVISPPPGQPAAPPPAPPVITVMEQGGDDEIEHAPEPDELESGSESEPDPEPVRIDFTPIIHKKEHQYLRIPLDRDIVIPLDKAEVESLRYDDEEEEEEAEPKAREMTVQEIQDQMEARFFTATPTTTISRTDGEFNTSQMDSSGLDELPLKKDARKGFTPRGFQQRIQSQAGRLRTRIRNIQRPKINLPDRPKLHLPERPKFNFPERPKFNLPERPQFNIKRPELKMPNFNFGKNKTSSIRRPLRDRTQIPSDQSTVGSKKKMFDSINFSTYPRIFSKKKKDAQGRRAMTPPPRMETESSPPSSPASRTGAAGGYGHRWSQRFKDIKFADDDTQSDIKKPSFDDDVEDDSAAFRDADFKAALVLDKKQMKAMSSSSIPRSDGEQQSSGSSSERHRAGVIEEIDSDEFFLREKGLSREDVDVSRYLSMEIRDAFRSPKNALAGFDGDLYPVENEPYRFETQRPLGGEPIRQSMEAMRNQSIEQIRMTPDREIAYEIEDEPVRPERARSLKKRPTRSKSEEKDENQFKTYPPNRPSRMQKQSSQSKQSLPFDDYNEEEKNIDKRPPSVPSLAVTDTTKEMSPSRYIDESSEALNEPWVDEPQPPLPPKRRRSTRDSSLDNESLGARRYNKDKWLMDDVQAEAMVLDNDNALRRGPEENILLHNGYYDRPPALPMRKTRSQATSLADEDRTSRGADSLISETRTHLTEDIDVKPEPKAFIPENYGYAVVEKPVIEVRAITSEKPSHPPPPSRKQKTAAQLANLKNQSINFFFTYPRRAIKKSLHKKSPPPIRPLRNYSSIGPSRPPRRNRVFREPVYEGEFIPLKDENDPLLNDDTKSEIIDDDKKEYEVGLEPEETPVEQLEQEVQESRDLQSGDVIEKMKGRPLPPPPRPPRKTRDDYLDSFDGEFRDDVQVTDLDDEEEVVVSERIDILVGHLHLKEEVTKERSPSLQETPQTVEEVCERVTEPEVEATEPVEEPPIKVERRKKSLSVTRAAAVPLTSPVEVNISTQTDSLPEGYCLEDEQTTGTSENQGTIKAPKREKRPEVEKIVETVVEHKVVVIPTPETEILKAKKIHVSELEVERLNVSELQAKKITVSDIDGVSMQVTELTSKSGHLIVSGIDLPASFLEAITPHPPPAPIIQIQSATQTPPQMADSQTNTVTQEVVPPPVIIQPAIEATPPPIPPQPAILPASPSPALKRPSPPPSIIIQTPQGQRVDTPAYLPGHNPVSPAMPIPPPRSPTRTRSHIHESEEDLRLLPRRRRHHSKYPMSAQLSSDEDEAEFPSYPIVRRTHQHEPGTRELLRQLANIWEASMMRGVDHVVDGLNAAFPEGEKRKDAQTAACIVLVLIAGLLMLGFGSDKTVHHHHWDFMPPHP